MNKTNRLVALSTVDSLINAADMLTHTISKLSNECNIYELTDGEVIDIVARAYVLEHNVRALFSLVRKKQKDHSE